MLKGVITMLLSFIIIILLELLLSRAYFIIFNVDYVVGMNIPIHRFIGSLFMYFIIFLVYWGLKYFKVNFSKIHISSKKHKYLLILNIVFGIILVAFAVYIEILNFILSKILL